MRQKRTNSSFQDRFVICFIFMIILPILCAWWAYECVLKFYYAENNLATQQINMEKSLSILDSSLEATANTFVALKGNQEILYYMQYQPNKYNMSYGTFKRVNAFCEELYLMTPYLSELKIYCDSSLPIYADPFYKMEHFNPDSEYMEAIEQAGLEEIVWKVAHEEKEFPAIYAYRKLYSNNFLNHAGYIEIRLSPQLLEDYFDAVSSLSVDNKTVWSLYHGDRMIYTTGAGQEHKFDATLESGYEVYFLRDRYYNCIQIPRLDLKLVCSGKISDVDILPSENIPSILFSVILFLLLALFIIFFGNIVSLSRRIREFSFFIRHSDPEKLTGFESGKPQRADELDVLIDAYNSLIRENNSLISHIRKMELFTQDARYQALQGQIHPHFIYGTLETIRMTALQNKDCDAASMIFSLSSLLRYSMSISSKAVTLKDELEIADHYLKIQNIRFNDRIHYYFEVEEELMNLELPYFILQPILENAVMYGISQTLQDCSLVVQAYRTLDQIVLRVTNTGLLIQETRLREINALLSGEVSPEAFEGKHNGLALNNIKERLAIFYDRRATISLALEAHQTVTQILIDNKEAKVDNRAGRT